MIDMDPVPSSRNGHDCVPVRQPPPLDPAMRDVSDRYFVNIRSECYRSVRVREADMLALPWGPRIDVMFDPRSAPGIVGGRVRVMARTAGTEVEAASVVISNPDQPFAISVAAGCDEYVVRAQLGFDPGPNARQVESYFFARVYSTR